MGDPDLAEEERWTNHDQTGNLYVKNSPAATNSSESSQGGGIGVSAGGREDGRCMKAAEGPGLSQPSFALD